MTDQKYVWIVQNIKTGELVSNYSTGTRVYTKRHNAIQRFNKMRCKEGYAVVEYELVPTGTIIEGESK